MPSFKSQIQDLWSIKHNVNEVLDSLLDTDPDPGDPADEAVKSLYDAIDLVEEAISFLVK